MDIIAAYSEIATVIDVFKSISENISTHHERWFLESNTMMSALHGETASVPRTSLRNMSSNPSAAASPSDFYRIEVSIPMLVIFFLS